MKFFLYTDGRLGVPARRSSSCSRSCTRPTRARSRSTSATLAAWNGARSGTAEVAVPRRSSIAFAVKVPLFPFHTWLPDVHTEAPTAGSVVLAGVHPEDGRVRLPALLVRAVPAGGGRPRAAAARARGDRHHLRGDRRRDADRPETHHRVLVGRAHGLRRARHLRAHDPGHRRRASFTMLSHGLTTGALFLARRHALRAPAHVRDRRVPAGSGSRAPVLGGLFLAATFASIGLPGFSGFVGEFLSLLGTFLIDRSYAIVATAGVILAAVYLLWAFQRAFTGEPRRREREDARRQRARARAWSCRCSRSACSSASTRSRCSTASSRR